MQRGPDFMNDGVYLYPAACQCFGIGREEISCRRRHGELQQVCHLLAALFRPASIRDIVAFLVDGQTEQRPKVRVRLVAEKRSVAQHAETTLLVRNELR